MKEISMKRCFDLVLALIASFILIAWIGISISILSNPVCDIYSSHDTYDNQDNSRIVAVGDIHGSFTEFMETKGIEQPVSLCFVKSVFRCCGK